MGVTEAAKFGGIGFLIDRFFHTGFLGTLAGAAYGGLFKPDAGEMNNAYDKRKATVNQTLKDFLGFDMTDLLSGTASKLGTTPDAVKPSFAKAKATADARDK